MDSLSDDMNQETNCFRNWFFIDFPYATDSMEWFTGCVKELKAQASMRWVPIYDFLKKNKTMFPDLFKRVEDTQRKKSRKARPGETSIPAHLRKNKKFLDELGTQTSAQSSSSANENSAAENTLFLDRSDNVTQIIQGYFLERIEKQFKESCEITEDIDSLRAVNNGYVDSDYRVDLFPNYIVPKSVETFFLSAVMEKYETVANIRNRKSHRQMFKTDVYDKSVAFWSDVYFASRDYRELALICMLIHSIPITTVDVERTFKTAKKVDGKQGPLGTEKKEKETILCENFSRDFVKDEVWEKEAENISLKLLMQKDSQAHL